MNIVYFIYVKNSQVNVGVALWYVHIICSSGIHSLLPIQNLFQRSVISNSIIFHGYVCMCTWYGIWAGAWHLGFSILIVNVLGIRVKPYLTQIISNHLLILYTTSACMTPGISIVSVLGICVKPYLTQIVTTILLLPILYMSECITPGNLDLNCQCAQYLC